MYAVSYQIRHAWIKNYKIFPIVTLIGGELKYMIPGFRSCRLPGLKNEDGWRVASKKKDKKW